MGSSKVDSKGRAQYLWLMIVLAAALILAIVDFTLACFWAYYIGRDSPFLIGYGSGHTYVGEPLVELVFYSGTMPTASTVWAAVSLIIALRATIRPVLALVVSIFLITGWAVQLAFWFACEEAPPNRFSTAAFCPTRGAWPLSQGTVYELGVAKNTLGVLIMTLILAFMGLTSIAVHKSRKDLPPDYTSESPSEHGDDCGLGDDKSADQIPSETLNDDHGDYLGADVRNALEEKNDMVVERSKEALDSFKVPNIEVTLTKSPSR